MTNATEPMFVGALLAAGSISWDEAHCLTAEVENLLNADPYGIEPYESVWEVRGVQKVYLVSAYHVSRRYGGPEEGGWWFTQYDALTLEYAQDYGRAFTSAGPFRDKDDAWEVARDLNALEVRDTITWRVQDHAPCDSRPPVYC